MIPLNCRLLPQFSQPGRETGWSKTVSADISHEHAHTPNGMESLDCPAIDRSVLKSNELVSKAEYRLSFQLCHCIAPCPDTKEPVQTIDFTFLSQTPLLEIRVLFRTELGPAICGSVVSGSLQLYSLSVRK